MTGRDNNSLLAFEQQSSLTHSLQSQPPLEAIEDDLKHALNNNDKASVLHLQVLRSLFDKMDFILVGLGDDIFEGGVRVYARSTGECTYRVIDRLPLRRLILRAARALPTPIALTGSQVSRIMETFKDRPPILTTIERRVFQVSHNLYFNLDAPEGQDQLVWGEELPSSVKCFFRLFDTSDGDKDIVAFPQSTFDTKFSSEVFSAYNSLLSRLEELAPEPTDSLPIASLSAANQDEDPLPRHFSFIDEWADGNPGLYWDLLTIPATVFLKEKPQVSYFLSGTGANGKSSYLGLIHTVLGTNNTTRVRVNEMDKWHLNIQLQYTLFNAPDDEGDKMFDSEDAMRIFKSLSGHATVSLPIMRSQKPMQLKADFMSAHPMNASPEWGDTSSASALTRRTCLVPFTANFKKKANTISNFAKENFTPEVLAKFTGEVLALATFYSEHPIKWSDTVSAAHEQVEEENDSLGLYQKSWEKYFGSFQNLRLLYEDYMCWCVCHDLPYTRDQGAFKVYWRRYTSHRDKAWVTGVDYKKLPCKNGLMERENCMSRANLVSMNKDRIKRGLPPLLNMLELTILPYKELEGYGTISEMHHIDDLERGVGHSSLSAVYLMERMESYGN